MYVFIVVLGIEPRDVLPQSYVPFFSLKIAGHELVILLFQLLESRGLRVCTRLAEHNI